MSKRNVVSLVICLGALAMVACSGGERGAKNQERQQNSNADLISRIGSTDSKAQALYDALDVEEIVKEEEPYLYKTKTLEGMSCSYARLSGADSYLPVTQQYECNISLDQTPEQMSSIYQRINTMEQGAGYGPDFKVVGDVVFVNDDNSASILEARDCVNVYSLDEAKACMQFFADNVFPSFEDDNVFVMTQDKTGLTAMDKMLDLVGGNGTQSETTLRDSFHALPSHTLYLGVLLQHTDEEYLTYFYIEEGNDVMPKILARTSPVELSCSNLSNVTSNMDPDLLSLGLDGEQIDGWDIVDLEEHCYR